MLQEKDPSADAAFAAAKAMKKQSSAGDQAAAAAAAVATVVPTRTPRKLPARGPKPGSVSAKPPTGSDAAQQLAGPLLPPQTIAGEPQLPDQGSHGQSSGSALQHEPVATPAPTASSPPPTHPHQSGDPHLAHSESGTEKHLARIRSTDQHAATGSTSRGKHDNTVLDQAANVTEHCNSLLSGTSSNGVQEQARPFEHTISAEQDSASAPVLSFELEDADGPLEGAEHGINAKFGRLKVIAAQLLMRTPDDSALL